MFRVVADGPGGARSSAVEVTPFVIGSGTDCGLVVADPSVDPRHAQLEVQPDGRIVLRDLGSTAGTFVGWNRVTATWLDLPGAFKVGSTQVRVTVEPDRPVEAPRAAPFAAPVVSPPPVAAPPPLAPSPIEEPRPAPTPPVAAAAVDRNPLPPAPPPAAIAPVAAIPAGSAPIIPPPVAAQSPVVASVPPTAAPLASGSVATPIPQPLRRGLLFLGAAGVIEIVGAAIVFAVLATGALDLEGGASTVLLAAASFSLVAGVAEIALAWLAGRREAGAANVLIVLALVLAAIAAWDTFSVITAESGNIALPALRLGLNLGGAVALIKFRGWYVR